MAARLAISDPDNLNLISAVTACEFADLNARRRFGGDFRLEGIAAGVSAEIVPFPSVAWRIVERLPDLHRDPVDRMLIAHAIDADLTLVTADSTIWRYPVSTLW